MRLSSKALRLRAGRVGLKLPLRLCSLLVLVLGLLVVPGTADAAAAGKPVAWGCGGGNDHGQCNAPLISGVSAVAAGVGHSLALRRDGTVAAWGCQFNNFGQCNVPAGLSGVSAIAAADDSIALKSNGTVVAWGCGTGNDRGQCNVPAGLSGVSAIAAGLEHTLALKSDGTVVAWGCAGVANDGQCSVPIGLSGVTAIAAGTAQSLAVKNDGTVIAWGCNPTDDGQCDVPIGLSGVTAIAADQWQSLALKSDGTVVAWGCSFANYGQCSVPASLSGVSAIAAGYFHSLALKSDGTVVAWGCGGGFDYGECSVPAGLAGVAAIAAGDYQSLAVVALPDQTISFGPLPARTFGDPDFPLLATASSGLRVSFSASGNCSVVYEETVHINRPGSCTVVASQPGYPNFNPAQNVSRTFAIAKAGQAIAFGPLANKTYGDPDFGVHALASSGLPVSFAAGGNCAISGTAVHLSGVGSCTITASQGGNATFNPAPAFSRSFSIRRPPCTVPKVVGTRVATAKRLIASRHCRTGKVGHAFSNKRKKGVVISQSRRPGRVLPAGSRVSLVVSQGRRRR
jgi:Regulator of Chromosome Condensation (RCC1) repeat protein/PASTA domain-containing protein